MNSALQLDSLLQLTSFEVQLSELQIHRTPDNVVLYWANF